MRKGEGLLRTRFFLLAGLVSFLLAASVHGYGGTIKVTRPPADAESKRLTDLRAGKWLRAPVKDAPSKRGLVKASRKKLPQGFARQYQNVLRLCAIRVEFESVPDPSKISGNADNPGRFDLSDKRSTVFIDPPPHNRKYFSKHMEAMADYYQAMSYGNLKIEWEVFPLETDRAYMLPGVEKYNPQGTVGSWDWANLEVFFRDAIDTADTDPNLRFSDFDGFVIFHAGSDWQNDLRSDSPYDIPSFFISLADSIAVDDGTYFVFDGSVVPETSSQDGYLNGLNGVVAHEVGHQLGLPDLYDTQSGLSVVGYWDLMDFGSGVGVVLADPRTEEAYYVTGIIPGSLSAWSKSQLGWVVPDTVWSQGTFSLDAAELQGGFPNREALFVRMNSYESYLVENRQNDVDGDSAGILLADPSPDSTGVIMGPVNQNREFNYEYDWALPGGGLLVWHVDDFMVNFGFPYDVVNGFPPRRGLTLVEADGIPDLGDYNSFYFLGSPYDPFFKGNNDRLGDETYPNSRSNTGCHSHIELYDISESSIAMNLRASYGWRKNGFPLALGDSLRFGVPSLLVTDLDGDERDEVEAALQRAIWKDSLEIAGGDTLQVEYVVYSNAEIYAFESSGHGQLSLIPGWPRRLHGTHPTELVGADLNGDSEIETIVADETGRVYAFKPDGSAYFERSDSLGAIAELDGINGVPVAYTDTVGGDRRERFILGTDEGLFFSSWVELRGGTPSPSEAPLPSSQPIVVDLFDWNEGPEIVFYSLGSIRIESLNGANLGKWPVPSSAEPDQVFLAAADLDRLDRDEKPGFEIMLVVENGWVWVLDSDGKELPGWGKKVCDQVVGPPAFADINSDGYLEVILTDRNLKTRALTWQGSGVEGWPETWYGCGLPEWDPDFYAADTTITVPSAIVADPGCSGQLGVFQGSLFDCIVGWEPGGDRLGGFPLTLGGGCSSLALGDIDGDMILDLIAGGGDGNMYAFSLPVGERPCSIPPWPAAYFDRTRNCVYPTRLLPPLPEPGTRLLVANTFHAFPNPANSNTVTFSFVTETGGLAQIEVFDLAGDRVKTVDFNAFAETERSVNISGLANGLYVCRLTLKGDGKSTGEFFKLAIKR